MKKILFFLFVILFVIQSCSVESEVIFHKDKASSTMINIDMKDAMTILKARLADTSKTKKSGIEDIGTLPKNWTSAYGYLKKKEWKIKDPDSIKILKKIFVKSNFDNTEMSGFSLKMDRFSKDDYFSTKKILKNNQLPIDQLAMNSWDGKTLTIDTENLSLNGLKDILSNHELTSLQAKTSLEYAKMIYKKIGTTLKFDKKIKSISGKHDWITKVDDYSVRINYDLSYLFSEEKGRKPLVNSDKQIIITTE
ncbi:hypothetical protein GCM10023210_36490 [Chryseobacterium ginsengisoli]|uniref:Lipoprotein n=1 Tax=Chryseobacterium ginsengisoli TaxID=363853 RepID=A0ABP9MNI8_9FLAO